MTLEQALPLVVPLAAIQLGLAIFALWDLLKAERRVRGDSKIVWGLVIIFVGMIGPILYLVAGRRDE
jgi:Phospholipase_D-nuclease N-terminal